MQRPAKLLIAAALVSGLIVSGCAIKTAKDEIGAGVTQAEPAKAEPAAPAQEAEAIPDDSVVAEDVSADAPDANAAAALSEKEVRLNAVYFDFDKYAIRDSDKDVLKKNAVWISTNANKKVVIEGHADERGETEYNLALGDKRARSIKSYLVDLGIDPSRLEPVSFGEEKPADAGHTEDAWAKNRRAEFVVR